MLFGMPASHPVAMVFTVLLASHLLDGDVLGCQLLVPSELLNGCTFDTLTLTVPTTSYSIDRDTCNDVIDKEVFDEQPYVYFSGAQEDKTYMVVMLDPDVPNHASGEFVLHWAVVNIPGYILKQGLGYNVADTIIDYMGPEPAAFSGPHRFMTFAYEQLAMLDGVPVPASRMRFSLADWLETLGGEDVIRGPVASGGYISEF